MYTRKFPVLHYILRYVCMDNTLYTSCSQLCPHLREYYILLLCKWIFIIVYLNVYYCVNECLLLCTWMFIHKVWLDICHHSCQPSLHTYNSMKQRRIYFILKWSALHQPRLVMYSLVSYQQSRGSYYWTQLGRCKYAHVEIPSYHVKRCNRLAGWNINFDCRVVVFIVLFFCFLFFLQQAGFYYFILFLFCNKQFFFLLIFFCFFFPMN